MIDGFNSDAVDAALLDKAKALLGALKAQVIANLSGEILQPRSGALLDSIDSDVEEDGSGIMETVESSGVPYAEILEYGGKTAAHEIVATKARALAFMAGGALRFAKSVQHPGSVIRAYAFMGGALDALEDEIRGGLKDAVIKALVTDELL